MADTVNGNPPRTSIWQPISDFLPLIIPVAVVLTFGGFYGGFLRCSEDHPCSPFTAGQILSAVSSTTPTVVAIYVARASWTLINGVHLLACAFAIATAGIVMYSVLSEDNKKVHWTIIPLVIAACLNIGLVVSLLAAHDVWSPAQQLFRGTIGGTISWINKFNRFIEAFSLTGTLSLAVAACTILRQPDPNQPLSEEQLMRRVRLLRPVLYVGAATLVMAVLRLAATHAWAISYLPTDIEPGKSITTLITGIVGSLGTTYTLLIAGIYLPAALILRERLRKLPSAQADPEGFLATRGLSPTLTRILPRVMALIAPLLAGPLGDALVKLINSLGGAS